MAVFYVDGKAEDAIEVYYVYLNYNNDDMNIELIVMVVEDVNV